MSAIDASRQTGQAVGKPAAAVVFLLVAAGLLLGSAALQFIAAFQRWVVFSGSLDPMKWSAEDHLYDYFFVTDPWESVGATAQLFGAASLIQALGVVSMALAMQFLPNKTAGSAVPARATVTIRLFNASMSTTETVFALVTSGVFAFIGSHALMSGIVGTPSALQGGFALGWLSFPLLIFLAVRWNRKLPAAKYAALFLLGSSWVGLLVSNFLVASLFFGPSHDTAPWTEGFVAASTAAAGMALIMGVVAIARQWKPSPRDAAASRE